MMPPPLEFLRFENQGLNLYGTWHRPDGDGPFPTVLFCHGFTGQKYEPGWLFVRAARALVARGIAAFRFDCRFTGESDGDFQDMTISSEISDAVAAVDLLLARPDVDAERFGVLGFSMGGTVAAETARRRRGIRSLCFWAPVSNPPVQFAHIVNAMAGDTHDLGVAVVGRGWANDLVNHAPVAATREWGGPLCVVHGSDDATVPLEHGRAYLDGPGRREIVVIPGGDHAWNGAPIREQLLAATAGWFVETL